jgi:hypothetical protein
MIASVHGPVRPPVGAGFEGDEQRRGAQVDVEVVGGGDDVDLGVGGSGSCVMAGDDLPVHGQDRGADQGIGPTAAFAGSVEGGRHRRGFEFGELRVQWKTSRAFAGREDIAGATIRAVGRVRRCRRMHRNTAAEATMLLPSRL